MNPMSAIHACPRRRLRHFVLRHFVALVALILLGLSFAVAQDTKPARPTTVPTVASSTAPAIATAPATATVHPDAPPGGYTVAILPVEGMITDMTNESMQSRVKLAREQNADCVVFEIDTFGGLVTSALEICEFIKNLGSDIHTIAWVRPKAISAGAMISVACDEIIMSASARMGDCAPIAMAPTGGAQPLAETERAKAESPIIQEFRDSARRNGYDEVLSQAMVRLGNELYWLENSETNQVRFATTEEKEELLGEKKSSILPKWAKLGKKKTPWKLVESYVDPLTGKQIEVKQPIVGKKDLLTMSQSEAIVYGFARKIVSSETELAEYLPINGEILRLDTTWSEDLAHYLSSPIVRTFLFLLMMMAAYTEFNTPGLGVGGIVAVICLAVFLGAPYLTGLANVWEIVLVGIGIVLLMVEVFVIPGFGVAGIAGIGCVFIGLLASFMPEEPGSFPIFHWPTLEGTFEGLYVGLRSLAVGMVLSVVGMYMLAKYLPKTPAMATIAPENPTHAEVTMADPYDGVARMGDIGTTEGPLRPAGKARFGATLVDVVSQGDFIGAGQRIEVIERYGNRVVVRKARA